MKGGNTTDIVSITTNHKVEKNSKNSKTHNGRSTNDGYDLLIILSKKTKHSGSKTTTGDKNFSILLHVLTLINGNGNNLTSILNNVAGELNNDNLNGTGSLQSLTINNNLNDPKYKPCPTPTAMKTVILIIISISAMIIAISMRQENSFQLFITKEKEKEKQKKQVSNIKITIRKT